MVRIIHDKPNKVSKVTQFNLMLKLQASPDKQAIEIKSWASIVGLCVIFGIGIGVAIGLLFLFYCIKRKEKNSKVDDLDEAN